MSKHVKNPCHTSYRHTKILYSNSTQKYDSIGTKNMQNGPQLTYKRLFLMYPPFLARRHVTAHVCNPSNVDMSRLLLPPTTHPVPPSPRMAPKPNKPGSHTGATCTQLSCKRQASNAQQKASKCICHDNDNDDYKCEPEEQQEEDAGSKEEGKEEVVESHRRAVERRALGWRKGPHEGTLVVIVIDW